MSMSIFQSCLNSIILHFVFIDVNKYFSVLTHLSPESGYTLDYVYYYEFMGSEPIIYARQEQEEPYATFSQYREAIGEDTFRESRLEYLEHIESDGSAEGYFEWAVLAVQGGQFYLGWHSNYNDVTVLCSREAVKKVIERASELGIPMTPAQERKALKLDLEPLVDFEEETVRVQIVTFTKWGGFFRRIFVINRDFPHNIIQHESVELVSYDCGVQF